MSRELKEVTEKLESVSLERELLQQRNKLLEMALSNARGSKVLPPLQHTKQTSISRMPQGMPSRGAWLHFASKFSSCSLLCWPGDYVAGRHACRRCSPTEGLPCCSRGIP